MQQETELDWKDQRINILSEILNGIKVIKMYAWEKHFLAKVSGLRSIEIKYILQQCIGWAMVTITWEIMPFLMMLVVFITYVFTDIKHIITAEKTFVCLSLFNLLRFPMAFLSFGLTTFMNVI